MLYVTNQSTDGLNPASVTEYAAGSCGDAKPAAFVAGAHTRLDFPEGLFVDASGKIFVTNLLGNSVTVYPKGSKGDIAPGAAVSGTVTGLLQPFGVALDSAGNIYVTSGSPFDTVTLYPPGSTGNIAPATTIAGAQTGLSGPAGIAVDGKGHIFVANSFGPSVAEFPAGSSGNATPIAVIFGGNTGLDLPEGVALDAAGDIYASNLRADSVTEYAPGSGGDATPIATISGAHTLLSEPGGLALDAQGNIYVANYNANSVTEYAAGSNGNVPPIVTIAGPDTGLLQPAGLGIVSNFPLPTPTGTPVKPTPTPGPPPPGLSISPAAVNLVTGADAPRVKQVVEITNKGGSAIVGDIVASLDATQFIVTGDGAFRLPPKRGSTIHRRTVTVEFFSTSAGTFAGNLNVNTSAPDNSSVTVPVTVTAKPGLLQVAGSLDFGKVPAGQRKTLMLTIRDGGLGVLAVTVFEQLSQRAFRVESVPAHSDSTSLRVTSGQEKQLAVDFIPPGNGPFNSELLVQPHDVSQKAAFVKLSGTGQ